VQNNSCKKLQHFCLQEEQKHQGSKELQFMLNKISIFSPANT